MQLSLYFYPCTYTYIHPHTYTYIHPHLHTHTLHTPTCSTPTHYTPHTPHPHTPPHTHTITCCNITHLHTHNLPCICKLLSLTMFPVVLMSFKVLSSVLLLTYPLIPFCRFFEERLVRIDHTQQYQMCIGICFPTCRCMPSDIGEECNKNVFFTHYVKMHVWIFCAMTYTNRVCTVTHLFSFMPLSICSLLAVCCGV